MCGRVRKAFIPAPWLSWLSISQLECLQCCRETVGVMKRLHTKPCMTHPAQEWLCLTLVAAFCYVGELCGLMCMSLQLWSTLEPRLWFVRRLKAKCIVYRIPGRWTPWPVSMYWCIFSLLVWTNNTDDPECMLFRVVFSINLSVERKKTPPCICFMRKYLLSV